jgi:hypothetical protein
MCRLINTRLLRGQVPTAEGASRQEDNTVLFCSFSFLFSTSAGNNFFIAPWMHSHDLALLARNATARLIFQSRLEFCPDPKNESWFTSL